MKVVNNGTLCLYHEGSVYIIQRTHSISLEEILLSEDCLKQGDALSPLIFNLALEYVIRSVHAHQESLILNGTHQLVVNVEMLMHWAKAYILCIKNNTKALVVASRETGLEVNAEKFKYT